MSLFLVCPQTTWFSSAGFRTSFIILCPSRFSLELRPVRPVGSRVISFAQSVPAARSRARHSRVSLDAHSGRFQCWALRSRASQLAAPGPRGLGSRVLAAGLPLSGRPFRRGSVGSWACVSSTRLEDAPRFPSRRSSRHPVPRGAPQPRPLPAPSDPSLCSVWRE